MIGFPVAVNNDGSYISCCLYDWSGLHLKNEERSVLTEWVAHSIMCWNRKGETHAADMAIRASFLIEVLLDIPYQSRGEELGTLPTP